MTRKRFIAGAVCPSCGVQDTVRTFEKDGVEIRECVDCGFSDEMLQSPALVGETPTIRISHEQGERDNVTEDPSVQVVRILDN